MQVGKEDRDVSLTFYYRGTCVICGNRLAGIWCQSFRVNKTSLKPTSNGITALMTECRECGHDNGRSDPSLWALDEESAAKVKAARAKKGWA